MTIEEMFHPYEPPAVIASDYKIDQETKLSSITLYGVNKPVTADATTQLKPGQLVVFSKDPFFIKEVGIHFANMHDPTVYSGSTMCASLLGLNGTDITIYRIAESGKAELLHSDHVSVVYLEVGDKDHLVRVIPKM